MQQKLPEEVYDLTQQVLMFEKLLAEAVEKDNLSLADKLGNTLLRMKNGYLDMLYKCDALISKQAVIKLGQSLGLLLDAALNEANIDRDLRSEIVERFNERLCGTVEQAQNTDSYQLGHDKR